MNHHNQEGHLTDESIARYVEVLQSEDWQTLPTEIQEHIAECTTCHQEALDLYALTSRAAWSDQQRRVKGSNGGRLIRMRIMRWAMAAVLVGLSFYFYRYLDRPSVVDQIEADSPIATKPDEVRESEDGKVAEQKSPIPKKEDAENPSKSTTPAPESNVRTLYAANFVPSESMELLLGDQLRSNGLDLVKPADERVRNWQAGISFAWSGQIEEKLTLQLEDNRGEVLYAEPIDGLKETLQLNLEPGIYYWRLESEEDLLMVGRLVLE